MVLADIHIDVQSAVPCHWFTLAEWYWASSAPCRFCPKLMACLNAPECRAGQKLRAVFPEVDNADVRGGVYVHMYVHAHRCREGLLGHYQM